MSEAFTTKSVHWDCFSRRQNLAQRIYERINARISLQKDMDVMDLGAGTGLLTYKILPHVHSIVAIDTSEAMLEKLKEKRSGEDRIRTCVKDISKEPLHGFYDGVVSSMTLHHIKNIVTLFEHLYAGMKPGAFLAIADLLREDGSFHSDGSEGVHHFGFDEHELRTLISYAGFKEVTFEIVDIIQKERCQYPVFLLTAFK